MIIMKRSGEEVPFESVKILNAIKKANDSVIEYEKLTDDVINDIVNEVEVTVRNMKHAPSVEEIQDMVENQLMNHRAFNVARNYITYRYKRALVRKSNTTDEQILSLIECNNEEIKQENSNKNPTINSVQRDYMAGEVSKDITKRFLLPEDVVEAHEKGLIHFHDADYFVQHMHNCFTGGTKFITDLGVREFKSFKDGEEVYVKDKNGIIRLATVHKYGKQKMQRVTFKNCRNKKTIICTKNHRWILSDGTVTTNLSVGDKLLGVTDSTNYEINSLEDARAFCMGFVIGDGSDKKGQGTCVRLCGEKIKYKDIFIKAGFSVSPVKNSNDLYAYIGTPRKQDFINGKAWRHLSAHAKALVFKGLYAADGAKKSNRLSTADERIAELIEEISSISGYYISSKKEEIRNTAFKENALLITYHFTTSTPKNWEWEVINIENDKHNEVDAWCIEEPVTQSFLLEGGIVTGNCCLINLDDMLQHGTVISGTLIETPKSFSTACNIATQAIAQIASSQYGGQSVSLAHLAPFVDISRQKYRKIVKKEFETINLNYTEEMVNSVAELRVKEEIKRGVQMIQYQVITLMTTNGQAPFITVFMYLNEVKDEQTKKDLAAIIEEMLHQRILGVKNEKGVYITPAFPKLIYVLEEDNIRENSKYFYLTELAAKCTAKRMVPDYISEKKMKELKHGDVYACMGCRSFLTPDRTTTNLGKALNYKADEGKYYGRFNQGVVTLNLVDIACSSEGDEEKFWKIMDERLELCHKALRCRHERLLGTPSDVAPILWQHGALARLEKGETIDKLLYDGYSTISLGYAGLYETCYYMTGVSHTVPKGEEFAMKVMLALNDACAKWKSAENIDYSVYGTPLESTTYKFAKCLQKRFGVIEGVTDRNYITNSYHIHVTEKINAFDKLSFEAKFQELSPGGAISYVEVPNMQNNIPAVIAIIQHIYDNIMYAELNTKSDYCQKCGFDGEIQIVSEEGSGKLIWECPNCGNRDQDTMSVARRTCGYIGSNYWNQGRTQEIKERVLHTSDGIFPQE